jgi:hypothetical protein
MWRPRDFDGAVCRGSNRQERCTHGHAVNGLFHYRYSFLLNRGGFATSESSSGDFPPELVP